MGRKPTTGVYSSREELEAEVMIMLRLGMTWETIGRRAGVSATTAYNATPLGRQAQKHRKRLR